MGDYNGNITANTDLVAGSDDRAVDNLLDNELALARCVLFLGCKTGQSFTFAGKTYNLVQSTYDKGAHFVLGTLEDITVSDAYSFMDVFLENCSEKSIYDSISVVLTDPPLFDAYYLGDSKQLLSVE